MLSLHLPSLKEIAQLEDAHAVLLIFPIFHTFVCIFFPVNRVYPAKFKLDKCMEIRKLTSRVYPSRWRRKLR